MIYERLIQWIAGPVSAIVGVLAIKASTHLSFLGSVGLGKSAIAHAIQNAAIFGVTALVTYAAHHKWLDNLSKWWVNQGLPGPLDPSGAPLAAPSEAVPPPEATVGTAPMAETSGEPLTTEARLRAQLERSGIHPVV